MNKNIVNKRIHIIIIAAFAVLIFIFALLFIKQKKQNFNDKPVSENKSESVSEDLPELTDEEKAALRIANWDLYDSDLSLAKVGDQVNFGRYEQDGDSDNFEEILVFDVLAVSENSVLLISHDIIEQRSFHSELSYINWENCQLRQWLNSDFYETAFNDAEKKKIKSVSNNNPDSYSYYDKFYTDNNNLIGATGGNPTQDNIFLLSYEELIDYYNLIPSEQLIGYVSDKLKANACKAISMGEANYTAWWLRSPADNFQFIMYVSGDYIQGTCGAVDRDDIGVRPALWVTY